MNILFCSQEPLTRELGAPKVIIELGEALSALGVSCRLVGPDDISENSGTASAPYCEQLRSYLRRCASDYDVVDYGHEHLPFPRGDFDRQTLFVARSVMLLHNQERFPVPIGRSLRSKFGLLLKGRQRRSELRKRIACATTTVREADAVNVCNHLERDELVRHGIPHEKIITLPFALSAKSLGLFDAISADLPDDPIVAFVGTFDFRKGANEFPWIVGEVLKEIPRARFRLLGVTGMMRTVDEVLGRFPRYVRDQLEVIPSFRPEELPEYLRSCSLGIFPSYVEGFPFGVLEMLAASLPVIAYDSPGPSEILSTNLLVARGDWRAMSAAVIRFLSNRGDLQRARVDARERARSFSWKQIAEATQAEYMIRCEKLRRKRV